MLYVTQFCLRPWLTLCGGGLGLSRSVCVRSEISPESSCHQGGPMHVQRHVRRRNSSVLRPLMLSHSPSCSHGVTRPSHFSGGWPRALLAWGSLVPRQFGRGGYAALPCSPAQLTWAAQRQMTMSQHTPPG